MPPAEECRLQVLRQLRKEYLFWPYSAAAVGAAVTGAASLIIGDLVIHGRTSGDAQGLPASEQRDLGVLVDSRLDSEAGDSVRENWTPSVGVQVEGTLATGFGTRAPSLTRW